MFNVRGKRSTELSVSGQAKAEALVQHSIASWDAAPSPTANVDEIGNLEISPSDLAHELSDASVTLRMTRGGPKSETASRSGADK
eukprot:6200950-Pleurochrysis_carterae.AAC.2